MKEKSLLHISLVCSFVGIFLLGIFSFHLELPLSAIQDISDTHIGNKVFIEGKVGVQNKGLSSSSFLLEDETGTIKVVLFDKNIVLNRDTTVSVQGTIQKYNGELEVIGEKIILV